MDFSTAIALLAAGGFFLTGLVMGVWKFRQMWASGEGLAHPYVDIAHRASLLYAYACLLLAAFAHVAILPEALETAAVAVPMVFFAAAVIVYCVQGALKRTDNQLRPADRPPGVMIFMGLLAIGEIGGFLVLFYGVATAPAVRAALGF